jgi:hypothetical protein
MCFRFRFGSFLLDSGYVLAGSVLYGNERLVASTLLLLSLKNELVMKDKQW